jgi:hypothetical protein
MIASLPRPIRFAILMAALFFVSLFAAPPAHAITRAQACGPQIRAGVWTWFHNDPTWDYAHRRWFRSSGTLYRVVYRRGTVSRIVYRVTYRCS